jgi:serine/threonine-protein kinase
MFLMFRSDRTPDVGAIMIGKTISHYRILERLGEGGMGVVYRAVDTKLDRDVALKFLPSDLTSDPEAKERFIHEAKAASSLDHQSICTVYEIAESEDGQIFIAMACYGGETLRARIRRGPLKIAEAVNVAVQVSQGLAKAHERGIVHRDIKPANIIITDDGIPKIVDFGLAKLAGKSGLTRTGRTLGTIAYMSPEQVRGDAVDHRTDIWSLGVTLYEMLTGVSPFERDYEAAIMYSILNEGPQPMSSFRPGLSDELQRIIDGATAKNPDERYQTALDLRDHLAAYASRLASASSAMPSSGGPPASGETTASVAVLPFANLSTDAEQEYFCDGMAESITDALAHLKDLRVVARTSAFSFKGKNADIREIGRKLNVKSVVEGSVQKAGNRLRITVQLVSAADGYRIWSERYDRTLEDIFAIQDEISLAIVDKLRVKVLRAEEAGFKKRYTENPEAYNLYLKGRWLAEKMTEQELHKAIDYFRQAVALDSGFALAFAGIGDAYVSIGASGFMPTDEVYEQARAAAERALELDSTLSEGHTVLAGLKVWFDLNWPAAEHEFLRAFALDPYNGEVHHQYAHLLAALGRTGEAVEHMRKALELEPVSVLTNACAGQIMYLARMYDEAIVQLKKTVELDPNFQSQYTWLAMAYAQKGMYEEAIETVRGRTLHPTSGRSMKAALGYIYAVSGRTAEAREILNQLEQPSGKETANPYHLARIHAGLGEKELSLEWLGKCLEKQEASLGLVGPDPVWDVLRDEPRFIKLMETLGLGT